MPTLVLLLCASLAPGCASVTAPSPESKPSSEESASPIDLVVLDGSTYYRAAAGRPDTIPAENVDLQSVAGKVKSRLPANKDGYERLKDGDATYLEPGASLHAVEGYDPSFRIAARTDGAWGLYEVFENPDAERTAELLDIEGKAEFVSVRDWPTIDVAEEVHPVRRPEGAASLVGAVLEAPLRHISEEPGKYHLAFKLEDGTESVRRYEPNSGELYLSGGESPSGVVLPEEFQESIRQALRER